MNNLSKKFVTHVIQIPPVTSIPELLGNYKNLFNTLGVDTPNFPFNASEGFQHPIPESQQLLLNDYMQTMQLVNGVKRDFGDISLYDARITNTTVVFVFSYRG